MIFGRNPISTDRKGPRHSKIGPMAAFIVEYHFYLFHLIHVHFLILPLPLSFASKSVEPILECFLGLLAPYLYQLARRMLGLFCKIRYVPVFRQPWTYTARNYTKWYRNGTLQTSTPGTGLTCTSCCLRPLRLARGVSFTSDTVLEKSP